MVKITKKAKNLAIAIILLEILCFIGTAIFVYHKQALPDKEVTKTPEYTVTAIDSNVSDVEALTEPTSSISWEKVEKTEPTKTEPAANPQPKEELAQSSGAETVPQQVSDNFVTINLDSNKLTQFKNGVKAVAYPVATGAIVDQECITPAGQFVIQNKFIDPKWAHDKYSTPIAGGDPSNPLGHRWLGTSAGKDPGNSIGIHGNIDYASIGTHVSGGCIRMYNSDVLLLYEAIPIGTPVWIGTTDQLTSWGVKGFE